MKYFIDSAIISEIAEAYEIMPLDGITTNPKHIMNSKKSFIHAITDIAQWAHTTFPHGDYHTFPISVEINPHLTRAQDMFHAGKEIRAISPFFVIKLPCTMSGIHAAKLLRAAGHPINITLIFSLSQAIMAGKTGAEFVSPFVGWKESVGDDGLQYIADIAWAYQQYVWTSEIIVAAARTGFHIGSMAKEGAHITTASLAVFQDSVAHPFTDMGLGRFCEAWDNTIHE